MALACAFIADCCALSSRMRKDAGPFSAGFRTIAELWDKTVLTAVPTFLDSVSELAWTIAETLDGLFVFAPNSSIWTFPLRNHSRNSGRLVSFNVGFTPGDDMDRAKAILLKAISEHPGVSTSPPPEVFIDNVNGGAPLATCRFWAAHQGIGAVQRSMLDVVRRALEAADLPPTQLIRTVPADAILRGCCDRALQ